MLMQKSFPELTRDFYAVTVLKDRAKRDEVQRHIPALHSKDYRALINADWLFGEADNV
jgi:molybdate-binding protein